MRSVLNEGTGAGARGRGFTLDAAGKTGTTNDLRDAWFVGFTPELLTVVWVGFDDNQPVGLSGAQAALPIWTQFMKTRARRPRQRAVRRARRASPSPTSTPQTGKLADAALPEDHSAKRSSPAPSRPRSASCIGDREVQAGRLRQAASPADPTTLPHPTSAL